jgi:hypothetical protein
MRDESRVQSAQTSAFVPSGTLCAVCVGGSRSVGGLPTDTYVLL